MANAVFPNSLPVDLPDEGDAAPRARSNHNNFPPPPDVEPLPEKSGSNGNGIDASNTAVEINNTGVIASTDGIGLLLEDSTGSILNTSYINNSGTISSHVTSRSIDVVGDTAVEINNLGLITGGVRLSDVGDIIENGGTIGGDVELGAGDDLYDGFGDSQAAGAVYGDAGNDDLFGGDNSDTLYGGSEKGYTDYPTLAEASVAAE